MTATPPLLPHHRDQLINGSAISESVVAERLYSSATTVMAVKRYGFGEVQCGTPGLLMPVYGPDRRVCLYIYRPDNPRIGSNGKQIKYEFPRKSSMSLDIPPRAQPFIGDPTTPLLFTEGVKKADSAISNGFDCAIALLGVWNFRGANEDGGKTALAELEYVALNGREVFVAFDSDVMVKRSVYGALRRFAGLLAYRGAKVRYVYLPDGPNGAKVGLDDFFVAGHVAADVLALAEDELRPPPDDGREGETSVGPYRETPKGLLFLKSTPDGRVATPLTNFVARIVDDVAEDDGVEVRRLLQIRAALPGRVREVRLTAERFAAMNWPIELLGASGLVYPGTAAKEHARAAIQMLSGEVPERTVYAHLGWRERDDAWLYLHAGGAIGAAGAVADVEVAPPPDLARFVLPTPPEGDELRAAIRASLALVAVAPQAITIPLLAGTYRAALGGSDFSLFLVGPTGVGKSELGALSQQHYGAGLDSRHLPASWSSTGNALEGLAFAAKDTILGIDDFAPGGSQADMQRLQRDAERILRGQGNHSGRQRMTADGRQRPARPSRCLPLVTGEDVPRGQSARARALILEVGPDSLDWERLSVAQRLAADGVYAAALAGFVRWVAPQYDAIQHHLAAETVRLRDLAANSDAHRRTPGIVGSLGAAWRVLLDYAVEYGALDAEQAEKAWRGGWAALGLAAAGQGTHQTDSEPAARFIDLLRSALVSGAAHVADPSGRPPQSGGGPRSWGWRLAEAAAPSTGDYGWRAQGARVGWVDGNDLYLDRDAALAVAQDLARKAGDGVAVSAQTLTKRLAERGLLASTDRARETLTVRRTLDGGQRRVLHLAATALMPGDEPEPDDEG